MALCFITAAIFWLFNALNKEYSTNIRFPLHFEFDQNQFAPARTLPQTILINVNGSGWDLFRKYFGVKVPMLTINLERPTETKKIVGASLPPMLASQMGSIKINHIVLDTIRLSIEPRVSKKFKITTDLTNLTFRNDAGRISPVVISPDTVELSGPASVINAVADPLVITVPPKIVGKNFNEEIEVELENLQFVRRNPPVVTVTFDVGDIVDIEKKVIFNGDKLPWGYVSERDSVVCIFSVPRRSLDEFNSARLEADVLIKDQNQLKRGETFTYSPFVTGLPLFVELRKIDSVKVKRY